MQRLAMNVGATGGDQEGPQQPPAGAGDLGVAAGSTAGAAAPQAATAALASDASAATDDPAHLEQHSEGPDSQAAAGEVRPVEEREEGPGEGLTPGQGAGAAAASPRGTAGAAGPTQGLEALRPLSGSEELGYTLPSDLFSR